MPICFLTRHNNNISTAQQDLMAEAILAMEMVTVEELPLVATSIVEGALQQASGTRIPIKCFGCSGLPKYDTNDAVDYRNTTPTRSTFGVTAPTKAIKKSGRISRSTSRNSEKRNKPDKERDSNKVSMEEEETTEADKVTEQVKQ